MVGRQINFYFTPKDEDIFLTEVKQKGDKFATDKGTSIDVLNTASFNNDSHNQILLASSRSRIYFTKHGFIEGDQSEVIEYFRSISSNFLKPDLRSIPPFEDYVNSSRKEIIKGARIYHKGKFIKRTEIPIEDLKEKYDTLLKERVNPNERILSSSRLWAAMHYVKNSQWIEKEKWFKDWYDSYAKWIKKQCKLSKDKNFYIGEDAYKAYKDGTFIMKALGGFKPKWE